MLLHSHILHVEFEITVTQWLLTSRMTHRTTSPHESTLSTLTLQHTPYHTTSHQPHQSTPLPLTSHHTTLSPFTLTVPQACIIHYSATHRLLAAHTESDAQVSGARNEHPHSGCGSAGPNARTRTAGTHALTSAHTHADHVSTGEGTTRYTGVVFHTDLPPLETRHV